MAEQNRWEPCETQPEPLLPIPSRSGPHYGGMQESMGPFGITGPRRKVEIAIAPFQ